MTPGAEALPVFWHLAVTLLPGGGLHCVLAQQDVGVIVQVGLDLQVNEHVLQVRPRQVTRVPSAVGATAMTRPDRPLETTLCALSTRWPPTAGTSAEAASTAVAPVWASPVVEMTSPGPPRTVPGLRSITVVFAGPAAENQPTTSVMTCTAPAALRMLQGLADGELIGVRLPRSLVGEPVKPGRAHLHLGDGALITVAVPRGE